MRQYDFNNTYQNIIAREEVQLAWLAAAIIDLGGTVPAAVELPLVPEPTRDREIAELFEDDARRAQRFVDKWRDRVEAVTHARHRTMLRLTLGETLEHKRFFDQAAAGQVDLLGRHSPASVSRGDVLPTRWME